MEAAIKENKKIGLRSTAHHAQLNVVKWNVLNSARAGLTSMEHWYGLPEALFNNRIIQNYPPNYNYQNEQHRFEEAGKLWAQAAKPFSEHWNNVMDELIINYSSKVDWGNNWIKFFAAVAPLLGLLGTVIGMIETFQAITLFGTGDPKQMAGGISQALVTTMLGLIVAAPLLGFYTYLAEKSSSIVQFLEEKASYILSRS